VVLTRMALNETADARTHAEPSAAGGMRPARA